jgi:hypothetical protein
MRGTPGAPQGHARGTTGHGRAAPLVPCRAPALPLTCSWPAAVVPGLFLGLARPPLSRLPATGEVRARRWYGRRRAEPGSDTRSPPYLPEPARGAGVHPRPACQRWPGHLRSSRQLRAPQWSPRCIATIGRLRYSPSIAAPNTSARNPSDQERGRHRRPRIGVHHRPVWHRAGWLLHWRDGVDADPRAPDREPVRVARCCRASRPGLAGCQAATSSAAFRETGKTRV